MAQHFLLSADATTMTVFEAAKLGEEAFIVFMFLTGVEGRNAEDLARSVGWGVGRTRQYVNRIRTIMRTQIDISNVTTTAKARHTRMMNGAYQGEPRSPLTLAEAVWRDQNRRESTGRQFEVVMKGLAR